MHVACWNKVTLTSEACSQVHHCANYQIMFTLILQFRSVCKTTVSHDLVMTGFHKTMGQKAQNSSF